MEPLTAVAVAVMIAFAVIAAVQLIREGMKERKTGCTAHHFEDYTPTGHLRVRTAVGGECYLSVEKEALCEHQKCGAMDTKWDTYGKVAQYPNELPEYLDLVEEGL